MNLQQRIHSPTPSFFKKLGKWSIIIAGISGAILTAPISLPAAIISAAGYLAVAGAVAGAISRITIPNDTENDDHGRNE